MPERKGKEMRVYRVLVLNPVEPELGFGNPILEEKHFLTRDMICP